MAHDIDQSRGDDSGKPKKSIAARIGEITAIVVAVGALLTAVGTVVSQIGAYDVVRLITAGFRSPVAPTACERIARPSVLPAGASFRDCTCCPEMIALPNGTAMSKFEISKEEFSRFADSTRSDPAGDRSCYAFRVVGATGHWQPDPQATWKTPGFVQDQDEPVVCITWNDAKAYADWLGDTTGVQYEIPTKDDFVSASQADEVTRGFWRDDEPICRFVNLHDQKSRSINAFTWAAADCDDGFPRPADHGVKQTAGRTSQLAGNRLGIYHLIGNVYEWTSSDDGCEAAGQIWIWGGSWTSAPDKAVAAPSWCQSREFKAIDIGIRVIARGP